MSILDWASRQAWLGGQPRIARAANKPYWPEQHMWTVRTEYALPKPRETHKDRMAKLLGRRQRRVPGRDGEKVG